MPCRAGGAARQGHLAAVGAFRSSKGRGRLGSAAHPKSRSLKPSAHICPAEPEPGLGDASGATQECWRWPSSHSDAAKRRIPGPRGPGGSRESVGRNADPASLGDCRLVARPMHTRLDDRQSAHATLANARFPGGSTKNTGSRAIGALRRRCSREWHDCPKRGKGGHLQPLSSRCCASLPDGVLHRCCWTPFGNEDDVVLLPPPLRSGEFVPLQYRRSTMYKLSILTR